MSFSLRHRPLIAAGALATILAVAPLAAQQQGKVDLDAIYRIKDEGFAPGFRKAGDWAVKEMITWGLAHAKLEPWGPFGKGCTNDKFYATATTPGGSFPLIGLRGRSA